MGKVVNFEPESTRILRSIFASRCINFGTTGPHSEFSEPRFARVGFAAIPRVIVRAIAKNPADIVAKVKQHVARFAAEKGLDPSALGMVPHVTYARRERLYTDANPSSESHGKRKRGTVAVWGFDIRRDAVDAYQGALARTHETVAR